MPWPIGPCLAFIPTRLHTVAQIRLASTASNLPNYPYPSYPRPTPHQIFHLPHNASQKDIKLRYYDLVRLHHPDSPHCRLLSPEERHSRFQSITSAYDSLRGKSPSGFDPYMEEVLRRKRTYYAHHNCRAEYAHSGKSNWTASSDDRWKDRVILLVGALTLVVGLAPGIFFVPFKFEKQHQSAAMNLAQARNDAIALSEERRTELRKRLQDEHSVRTKVPGERT